MDDVLVPLSRAVWVAFARRMKRRWGMPCCEARVLYVACTGRTRTAEQARAVRRGVTTVKSQWQAVYRRLGCPTDKAAAVRAVWRVFVAAERDAANAEARERREAA